MKNDINNTNLDPDLDYESPDGMNRFRIETDDYYDDIWQEMIVIDATAQEFHNEFETVRKVINPKQAAALYWHSSMDAEDCVYPLERRHEILKMMWGSDNLLKYDITDFNEFRTLIENIDPFAFYVFTEVLYKTNMVICNGLWHTESLRALEERVDLLKKIKPANPDEDMQAIIKRN